MAEQKQGPNSAEAEVKVEKKDRNRSFSYPAFSLPEAIEKARTLWQKEKGQANWLPVRVASQHWGFSPTSSSGIRAVAALAHYGLIDEQGSKDSRRIRLNQRARTILLAPEERQGERHEAIRKAALTPKSYQALWAKHDGKLPSDAILEFDLQDAGTMNQQVIGEFIKDFKATIQFAKLSETPTLSGSNGADESGEDGRGADERDEPDEQSRRQKVDRMPDIQREAVDLPIPLAGGLRAVLRVPASLSEENYKRLTENLTTMLGLWKPAIVSEPEAEGA